MQDYNYWKYGCMEVTIEISCCKYPPSSFLDSIWLENKLSMIEYLKQATIGVKGIVSFENGLRAQNITIKIDSREPYFKTNNNGEFYRIILPGKYNLSLMLDCQSVFEQTIIIRNDTKLLVVNFILSNDIYKDYLALNLDKYGIFCTDTIITTKGSSLNTDKSNMLNSNVSIYFFSRNLFYLIFFIICFNFLIFE